MQDADATSTQEARDESAASSISAPAASSQAEHPMKNESPDYIVIPTRGKAQYDQMMKAMAVYGDGVQEFKIVSNMSDHPDPNIRNLKPFDKPGFIYTNKGENVIVDAEEYQKMHSKERIPDTEVNDQIPSMEKTSTVGSTENLPLSHAPSDESESDIENKKRLFLEKYYFLLKIQQAQQAADAQSPLGSNNVKAPSSPPPEAHNTTTVCDLGPAPGWNPYPAPGCNPYAAPGCTPYPAPGRNQYPAPGCIPYPPPGCIPYPAPGCNPYPTPGCNCNFCTNGVCNCNLSSNNTIAPMIVQDDLTYRVDIRECGELLPKTSLFDVNAKQPPTLFRIREEDIIKKYINSKPFSVPIAKKSPTMEAEAEKDAANIDPESPDSDPNQTPSTQNVAIQNIAIQNQPSSSSLPILDLQDPISLHHFKNAAAISAKKKKSYYRRFTNPNNT